MSVRTAIVTGGGSGIGAGIARRLGQDGYAVAVLDLNAEAAKAQADAIEAAGGIAIGLGADCADRAAVEAAVVEVRSRLGRPAILINCAGRSSWGAFLEISAEQWSSALATNLTSAFNCCHVVIPDMLDEGWGRIVNISSSSIHTGVARLAPYVAAKTGIIGLSKCLALEFAPRGLTVNTIPPGFIDTPGLRRTESRGFINVEASLERTPVGRMGLPEDIAAACSFLVRDEASYITGQVIGVNGGRFM